MQGRVGGALLIAVLLTGLAGFAWFWRGDDEHASETAAGPVAAGERGRPDAAPAAPSGPQPQDLTPQRRLQTGTVSGVVVDEQGRRIPDAIVAVDRSTPVSPEDLIRGPTRILVEGQTTGSGRFVLTEVPPGSVRVWATAEGLDWATTDVLEVSVEGSVGSLELVLRSSDPRATILLTVEDPDGNAVPSAWVQHHGARPPHSWSRPVRAGSQGEVLVVVEAQEPHTFRASDPEGRFRSVLRKSVKPGTHDLVLRLGPPQHLEVRAHNDQGPLDVFQVSLEGPDIRERVDLLHTYSQATDGVARVLLPVVPFKVRIQAAHHETTRLGPFDPDRAPSPLEVFLERLSLVQGRVIANGKGLPGAQVSLHRVVEPGEWLEVNGLPCRSERIATASDTTWMDGEFEFPLRETGRYYLRAEQSGRTGEAGPFTLDAEHGAEDLLVELPYGGAIEGRLLARPGQDPGSRFVAASRGDGFGFTRLTDSSGNYRFEQLMPGRWHLELRDERIGKSSTSAFRSRLGEPLELPHSCLVRSGQTTRFDLDASTRDVPTLHGRLRFSGQAPQGWKATLTNLGLEKLTADLTTAGEFTFTVPRIGPYALIVSGPLPGTSSAAFYHSLSLGAGERRWALDLPTGAIEGRFDLETWDDVTEPELVSGSWPRQFRVTAAVADDGTFALPMIPAGQHQLVYDLMGSDERSTDVLVEEGQTTTVVLR